ncbi:hypothetical protein GCM10009835_45940 [Planosporangium flavigriseum]|uniref:Uncharacterized protein n=1 Tax=Planosporangium flavigriseum TaxID=373681 RepID=A0A8J3LQG9_9ACTN|nr:hypothetical protein Pfl04_02750 [Planosporangium flavigriseum]
MLVFPLVSPLTRAAHREWDGRSCLVYNYDGEVDPRGAQSGAETR